ncbi:MAG: zf-HC2 domain-containing protein [Chloroflexota bacterium]|nr:zf-HC2 domain-containing protein [Chloroflexota bacterium]
MARGSADHSVWRELIGARLDRPLTRSETRSLTTHLRDCAACRQVDHDYREQRALLRALPPRPVPRDLWPRTSGALDREVARGVGLRRRARRASTPSAAIATSLAALGLIAMVGVMQLMPALQATPPAVAVLATPFAVAPQPLAWLGSESADLYVYQTHVGHVCPPAAEGCSVDDGIVRTQVNLPASVHARNVALSPSGKALALVGRDLNRDLIAVLILPPNDAPAPDPNASPPGAGPATSPGDGTSSPDATPGNQASDLPGSTPSGPPASAVPAGLQVLAILENVESAGAPPAWAPSGAMLAFSAMPADGSHGPDVYVWSPSDSVARPITTDHGSYFASWSGERIVLSRVAAKADAGTPSLRTIVIDPSTLEERAVDAPAMWLPVVNPARSHAVAWRGDLDLASGLALPHAGSLVMVDWARIDPYAAGNEPAPTDMPTDTPAASSQPPTNGPSPSPATSPSASGSAAPGSPAASPAETPKVRPTDASATPSGTDQPAGLPDGWTDLGLGRDSTDSAIVDWQARWSLDGQVLGVWIADASGTTWGRLTVFAIDPNTNQIAADDPLLPPTLARRGFSLGLNRVAWVAPSEDNPDGGLRVRTWDVDGVGGLRLLPDKLDEVVPAF